MKAAQTMASKNIDFQTKSIYFQCENRNILPSIIFYCDLQWMCFHFLCWTVELLDIYDTSNDSIVEQESQWGDIQQKPPYKTIMTTTPESRNKKKALNLLQWTHLFCWLIYTQCFNQLYIWPEYVIHKRSVFQYCCFLFSLQYLSFSVLFFFFFHLDVPFSHVCQHSYLLIIEMQRKKK